MQRCISLLLVLAYTTFYVVPAHHAHERAGEHSGGARHIHTNDLACSHDHAGHHHDHSHCDDAHSHHECGCAAEPIVAGPELNGAASEHDADAVYLPTLTSDRGESSRFTSVYFALAAVHDALAARLRSLQPCDGPSFAPCADVALGEHCALFLKLRTLRI